MFLTPSEQNLYDVKMKNVNEVPLRWGWSNLVCRFGCNGDVALQEFKRVN